MFNEKILYQNYFSNKISEETLAEQLKLSEKDFPFMTREKIEKDLDEKDAGMLEYHVYSLFLWEERISPEEREPLDFFADTLNRLLLCDWHKQHEDIVTLLQKISVESSVDVLYKAIYLKLPYLEWDDNFSFQKKCVRAINHIGGVNAHRYLELLCQEKNPIIRELAERKRREKVQTMETIEYIYDKQKDYGYIKSMDIHREIDKEECSKFNVKLTLVKFPCRDADDLFEITFERVSNLKIGNIENLFKVLMQITFIGDYQREDENYIVAECENDLFSFSCKKISVNCEE